MIHADFPEGFLKIENDGALIKVTNFWGSPGELAGKYYCSVNASAVRLLVPRSARDLLKEIRDARYVIVSIGPWPARNVPVGVEMLFEDDTNTPYALWFAAANFDRLPEQPEHEPESVLSVWTLEADRPQKAIEFPCKWRRSRRLPDESRWADAG